ncbi:MAG: hypothetical protein JO102_04605 [Elusimicrobia bacterium]|nr:hypothetical protein [Elusimicrobiota bacterium]
MTADQRAPARSFGYWFLASRPTWIELAVFSLLFYFPLFFSATRTPFYGDEKLSVQMSPALDAFLEGKFRNPDFFGYGYPTVTAPPMTRYVARLGRRFGTTHPDPESKELLKERGLLWAFTHTDFGFQILMDYRRPFIIIGVLCGLLMARGAYLLGGRVTGWVFVLLFRYDWFFRHNLPMVMNEGPLLLFALLAALECYSLLRDMEEFSLPTGRFLRRAAVCGLWVGLSTASKINGAVGVGAGVLTILLGMIGRKMRGLFAQPWLCFLAMFLVGAVALGTFIAINPFLYNDTVARMLAMVGHRLERLHAQPHIFRSLRVNNFADLAGWLAMMYDEWSGLRFPGATRVNFVLSMGGLLAAVVMALRWLKGEAESPAGLVAVVWGGCLAAPIFYTTIAWMRYFLFPVMVTQISIALALGLLFRAAVDRAFPGWRFIDETPTA